MKNIMNQPTSLFWFFKCFNKSSTSSAWQGVKQNALSFQPFRLLQFLFQVSSSMILALFWNTMYGRCTLGEGRWNRTPRQIFKKLANKNAIKPKIWEPPQQFCPKSLDPQPPGAPWIFNRAHQWRLFKMNLTR